MARDTSLYVRRAGLSLLWADADLHAAVGGRIYPPQRPSDPTWPFVGWGVPIVGPFEASCLDGAEIDFAVHTYAATDEDGAETVSGEELATELCGHVARVLAEAGEVDLAPHGCPFPATAHFTWRSSQVIQNGSEADAFHGIVSMRANVAS